MIEVVIPGFGDLRLSHLVCDYNGTLALDGELLPGVAAALRALADDVQIHVVTADTFGQAVGQLAGLPLRLTVLPAASQADAKLAYVSRLGADGVAAMGNGRNDAQMLEAARVGIALVQDGGCAAAADIVAGSIPDAPRHAARAAAPDCDAEGVSGASGFVVS
jgi:soluble P-type ATPase